MSIVLWVLGVLTALMIAFSRYSWVQADRASSDDFGSGAFAWLTVLASGVLCLVWLILAAIHWWPK